MPGNKRVRASREVKKKAPKMQKPKKVKKAKTEAPAARVVREEEPEPEPEQEIDPYAMPDAFVKSEASSDNLLFVGIADNMIYERFLVPLRALSDEQIAMIKKEPDMSTEDDDWPSPSFGPGRHKVKDTPKTLLISKILSHKDEDAPLIGADMGGVRPALFLSMSWP